MCSYDEEKKVLEHLRLVLETMGGDINDYRLVDYLILPNEDEKEMREINYELKIVVFEEDLLLPASLTYQQKHAYDMILERVFEQQSGTFSIGNVKIPTSMIIPYEEDLTSTTKLLNIVFPYLNQYFQNINTMINEQY